MTSGQFNDLCNPRTRQDRLGFAPVELGKIGEGGLLVQARGNTWAQLIFQDLVKFD